MKILYYLLTLAGFLFCMNDMHAQMRKLSVDANDNEVHKFSFYSPSEGYVAFTKWIGFTTDSGRTFTRKHISLSNVDYNGYPANLTFGFGIKGVKAFNRDTLIVYGDYGLVPSILFSIDRGNSFKLVYHDRYDVWSFKSGITDMVFPQNNNIGYAVEADRILKTTNKGITWSVIRLDVDRYFDYLEAVDNNNVIAFSTQYSSNKLYKTSNGGTTWIELPKPPGQLLYSHFLNANKGWSISRNNDQLGVMYYTSNGGTTWTQKNDPDIYPFYSGKFRFINDSTGFALAGFYVFKTTDSGRVWQPLPRDNDFTYLNYSHNDLQLLNANQLWAGGGHGLVEIGTNGGGNPLPLALFKADTTGVAATNIVNLKNHSKPIYQYKWFKNGTLISTAYHTSFTHNIYTLRDTISLVVSDGTHTDTAVRYIDYPKVWITGFTPVTAAFGSTVTITGYNFSSAYQVNFGGVRASSFSIVSNTEIRAVVSGGASGAVEVFTSQGNASLPGFSFIGPPRVDLPVTVSDSILCKSEPVTVTIHNSETGVLYQVLLSFFGSAVGSVTGNGGTVSLTTSPLTESGQYRILATRPGVPAGYGFPQYLNIVVEHPKARFTADGININPGEKVTYAAQAGEAKDYYWTFHQDASLAAATGVKAPAITYGTNGQKTLRLISVTSNGCRDTAYSNAVFVYPKPTADASCFVNTMDSSGDNSMIMDKVIPGKDDAIYVVGSTGNSTKLRSRVGAAKEFLPGNHSFFAKYTTNGVLKWAHYFKPGAGKFADAKTDSSGNIYLTGYAYSTRWLHFSNGDSTQIYFQPADTTYMGERIHGFIMKLNPDGKLLWQTLLYDHSELWQGYAVTAYGFRITVKNNHVMVIGGFPRNLSYVQNGVAKTLYEWPGNESGRSGNYAVLKIKDDGTLLWNARLRFEANNWYSLSDISVDKWGNSFLVGTYEESLSIHDAADVERVQLNGVVAYHKAFMVKYDSTGSIKWHNNFISSYQYGDAGLNKVEADEEGNTYVAGSMFNWGSPVTINITHSDGTILKDSVAAFALYKFDANGKRQWGVGSRYPYYGGSSALYVKNNDVYVAGTLSNNGVDVSSFVLSSTDGKNRNLVIGSGECFVVRYDSAGKFRRVYTSGQNPLAVSVSPSSLFGDSKGNFILGGNGHSYIGGAINTIYNIVLPHPLKTEGDGFFAKMSTDFCKPSLTADAGPDKVDCAGDTVSIGSKASGDYYSWTSNPAGFTSNLSKPVPRPIVNTTYYLKVTNEEGETAYDTVSVTLKPAPFADAGKDTTICSSWSTKIGTPPISGHSYQWYLMPASPFGSGTAEVYVSPVWTTSYYVRVVGPNGCPAHDTITVTTVPNAAPVVRIETPNKTICAGASVVFAAIAENAGSAPSYQWQVNSASVGINSDKYSTDSLKNNDRVTVLVTHNNRCVQSVTIISNAITMTVMDTVKPVVSLTGNTTVLEGASTTMTANVTNAGTNFQLKWQDSTSTHSWQDLPLPPVPATFEYKPQKTGDKIRCVLTVNNVCAPANVINSPDHSFIVNKVTAIDPVPAARYGLRYYPNPAFSTLIIDSLRIQDQWKQLDITSIDGRQTYMHLTVNNPTLIEIPVAGLSQGMYIAVLRNRKGLAVYLKFVKL